MTDLASSTASAVSRWADRLSLPVRLLLVALTVLGFVFALGVVIGVTAKVFDHGTLKLKAAVGIVVASAAMALLGWLIWQLSAYWRRPGRSAYERRYSRMMVILVAAGLPVGVLLGMAGDGGSSGSLFSNAPLNPTLAGLAAAVSTLLLASTLVLYHRTIDDHEQQAYLWANSLAFYFLALALPAAWLLARGGLIPPVGIGSVMLILLAAFVVNLTVWAWLKYR